MNEEKMITLVMETKERVDRLEHNGFTPADREQLTRLFTIVEALVVATAHIKEEILQINYHLRRIEDKFDAKFDMLQAEFAEMKVDVTVIKEDVSMLKDDMVKVKTKLVIA
jgi:flagellar capping protein FliD